MLAPSQVEEIHRAAPGSQWRIVRTYTLIWLETVEGVRVSDRHTEVKLEKEKIVEN